MSRPLRNLGPIVGSTDWMDREAQVVDDLIYADMEDFAYEERRELEWINEHMTEVMEGNTR